MQSRITSLQGCATTSSAPTKPTAPAPQPADAIEPKPAQPQNVVPASPQNGPPTPQSPQGPSAPGARHHLAGGLLSGLMEGMLFCPLDQAILRARLRTDPHATVRRELVTLARGGWRSMWRAAPLDVFGTAMRRASLPTILHTGKGLFSDALNMPSESLTVCMAAGATAGAFDPVFTNPPGRLRTVIQAPKNTDKKLNARSAFKMVYQAEGVQGLYKGLPTNMVRGAVYCTVIAASLQKLSDTLPPPESDMWRLFNDRAEWRKVGAHMGAAVCAVVAVSPLDVLLARKQEVVGGRQPVVKLFLKLLKEEGVRHLFTGTVFKVGMLAPRQALSLYIAGRITDRLFGERYESEDGDDV